MVWDNSYVIIHIILFTLYLLLFIIITIVQSTPVLNL